MDTDLKSYAHPVRAQLAVEELEQKLGIQTDETADGRELLDLAYEAGEPPD